MHDVDLAASADPCAETLSRINLDLVRARLQHHGTYADENEPIEFLIRRNLCSRLANQIWHKILRRGHMAPFY